MMGLEVTPGAMSLILRERRGEPVEGTVTPVERARYHIARAIHYAEGENVEAAAQSQANALIAAALLQLVQVQAPAAPPTVGTAQVLLGNSARHSLRAIATINSDTTLTTMGRRNAIAEALADAAIG